MNFQQSKQSGYTGNLGQKVFDGRVVDNKDPEGLGRVRVEILGKTDKENKEDLPWLDLMLPLHLGASAYTTQYAVPQVNTQVVVLFIDDQMRSGYVIGAKLNRQSNPIDPVGLSKPYKHPESAEHLFTKCWDEPETQETSFSMDMSEDYPYTWGWIDNAKNWFRVNMAKRFIEYVTNGLVKFKTYANGNTVLHITGHFKIVVDKDMYLEVRGNRDTIVLNNQYNHVIGNRLSRVDGYENTQVTLDMTDNARNIFQN